MSTDPNPVIPAGYDLVWSAVMLVVLAFTIICAVLAIRRRHEIPHTWLWVPAIVLLPGLGAVGWLIVSSLRPRTQTPS